MSLAAVPLFRCATWAATDSVTVTLEGRADNGFEGRLVTFFALLFVLVYFPCLFPCFCLYLYPVFPPCYSFFSRYVSSVTVTVSVSVVVMSPH